MHLAESPVKAKLNGTCSAGTGPDLTVYPHLTYAPAQWGEGVRIASNGRSVEEIVTHADGEFRETTLIYFADQTAARFGISLLELFDVLRYARANGMI